MKRLLPLLLVSSGLGLVSCEALQAPPPEELGLWADADAGVSHRGLARMCRRVWELELEEDPFDATYKGDPRFLDRVPRTGAAARQERTDARREILTSVASIPTAGLDERDRLTHELLLQKLRDDLASLALGLEDWVVDPLAGPHVQILNLTQVQPHGTAREREALVERWNRFGRYLRQAGANLERGKGRGMVASHTAVQKSIEQLDEILAVPVFDSPLVQVATGGGRWLSLAPDANIAQVAHEHLGDARHQDVLHAVNLHLIDWRRKAIGTRVLLPAPDDPLDPEARGRFLAAVRTAVEEVIYPALRGYRDVLADEILPAARSDDRPGLAYVPDGQEAYRTLIRLHTSLPVEECDPEAIHAFGLSEVARIRAEIAVLGQRVFGLTDVGAIQEKLRHDPELHFATREEVAAKASEALYRATARMGSYFGRVPQAACEVVRIASYEEKDSTIAYYRGPAPDGSRPGQYFINTYAPETRPRYEAEVLAYHEAIPGHHLQIAIAQELEDLPLFRRHGGSTAFVEGWALYTERLSDEMGLYSGDLDRLGVLSFDAWRACRLVVDTGLHAFGWTREDAIAYMYANTLLAHNNVVNEVDRYIAWPGQALAYKIGQREILALREEAREVLGANFHYPTFHDRVLENGAVTLESLRGVVRRWLEGARPGGAGLGE